MLAESAFFRGENSSSRSTSKATKFLAGKELVTLGKRRPR